MKTLTDHINEALKIGKNLSEWSSYSCQPKTIFELKKLIDDRISDEGISCDLNDIDTSLITNMSYLFYNSNFIGDISKWNTSNVKRMGGMFSKSNFNGDISNWDVSKVEDMSWMFHASKFNQDISNWNINKDCETFNMFNDSKIKEEYKPKSLR